MAEFLSERKLLFVRKKFDFPSKKISFSFEQKIRGLKCIGICTAVKFPIHCNAILDVLLCLFFTRTYVSPFMYVREGLRERSCRATGTYVWGNTNYCARCLLFVSAFTSARPELMFLEARRKFRSKIVRDIINLPIFRFYEYGDVLTSFI